MVVWRQGTATAQIDKPNPQIYVSPADGTIVPEANRVLFNCPAVGNFQWIGPGAISPLILLSYTITTTHGNYYCIVTDTSGCQLLSNSIAIENYSSPTLIVTPPTICNGSTALIQLVISGGAWQWQPAAIR